jgi:thioredoxin 1
MGVFKIIDVHLSRGDRQRTMPIQTVIHTNRHSIDRVLNAGLPVALVFWARSRPLPTDVDAALSSAASRLAGKLLIARVDAGDEPELARQYGATGLPALTIVKAGKSEPALHGNLSVSAVNAWLDYAVGAAGRPAAPQAQARAANGRGEPVTLTDATFQETVSRPGPVLVDFWAPWCAPCRMVAPAVEQLAREFQGRAVVGKLNVDENPLTQQRYRVMSIPTLYIFKNGQVVDQIVGAQPLAVLQQRLARFV